jgi:dTDP-4-dehydrorhamnose reductase
VIYVIGGRGFVGSAFVRLFEGLELEHRVVTRENFEALRGTSCDVLINANGNSNKLLASRESLTDFDMSVRSVAETIDVFSAGAYLYLSSGDVYPDTSKPETTREEAIIDPARQSRYGLHKRLAEELVCGTQKRRLVIRMGGFVGPGLKKNAIFDMINNAPVWLSPASELQFISTDTAARIVWGLVKASISGEFVNLGACGLVNLGEVHRRLGSKSEFRPDAPTVLYELSLDKLASLSGEPLPDANAEVTDFLVGVGRELKATAA